MKRKEASLCLLILFLFCISVYAKYKPFIPYWQSNTPPVVTIINPKKGAVSTTSSVAYSISVTDKEDGDSKYEEINIKEVLLQVMYVGDTTKLPSVLNQSMAKDDAGLAAIQSSNCFNCHNFNSKLAGPSFTDIGKKYSATAANMALLQKHILEGSVGVWGNVSMPSHPELTKEQAAAMVKWIQKSASSPDVMYYTGTEGKFTIAKKGEYLLTASYTDHGVENAHSQRLKGTDRTIIYYK